MKHTKEEIWEELLKVSESAIMKCIRDLSIQALFSFMMVSPQNVEEVFLNGLSKRLRAFYYEEKFLNPNEDEIRENVQEALDYFEEEMRFLESSYFSEEELIRAATYSERIMNMSQLAIRAWVKRCDRVKMVVFLKTLKAADPKAMDHVLLMLNPDDARKMDAFADFIRLEDYPNRQEMIESVIAAL